MGVSQIDTVHILSFLLFIVALMTPASIIRDGTRPYDLALQPLGYAVIR
jgi:hypothetical protein